MGCGWLGLPLAEYLVEKGYFVNGSTTTTEKVGLLKKKGINPYLIKVDPEVKKEDLKDFFETDILIINIPPSLRKNPHSHHIDQIQNLIKSFRDHSLKVIFISSTSVYPENEQLVDENDAIDLSNELSQVEELIKAELQQNITILRCGGLMGYERIPGKYFAGKKDIPGGNNPVNYVHRDDVIRIIYEIIEGDFFGDLYNVVAPVHPKKREVSIKTTKLFEMEAPHFKDETAANYKIVKSNKITDKLQYSFKYPDPINFFYKL